MPPDTTETAVVRNGGSRPVPDPTELTDKAIAKLKEQIEQELHSAVTNLQTRLDGIDEATKLRLAAFDSIPGLIDSSVRHLADVSAQKFEGLATQLRDRDTLSRRESELNALALAAAFNASKEAVAAALTAQKEAAAKQDEANAKAIDKSERATAETIKTNQELSATRLDALTKTLDEVKERVGRIEFVKVGAVEQRSVAVENRTGLYATVGLGVTLVLFVIALLGFLATRGGA